MSPLPPCLSTCSLIIDPSICPYPIQGIGFVKWRRARLPLAGKGWGEGKPAFPSSGAARHRLPQAGEGNIRRWAAFSGKREREICAAASQPKAEF